jgi:tetratricopeptide (TPR) repeat protein
LTVATQIWFKQRKITVAHVFAQRAVEVDPQNAYAWSNLGMLEEQLYRFDKAEAAFKRGLSVAKSDDAKGNLYLNWASALVNKGDWEAAEPIARQAYRRRPESQKTRANLGMVCLARGEWAEGWPLYDAIIGFDNSRRKVQYRGEPVWDGSPGKRIVIYGEQGLGDEVCFASMIPDALERSRSVVIDCTDKLAGLFRRSFPKATVYGTRWETGLGWDKQDAEIDASVSMGGLGRWFRNDAASFPRTPYLEADPERRAMWRALFDRQRKPVIGIAWTGGVPWTGDRYRKWTLDDLLPVFRSVDAVWVSLQYKDAGKEIAAFRARHPDIDLRQYAYATLTQDYDDTAALVAECDLVFSMQTGVIHLAGALGKDCWCFVNSHPGWRYGASGDSMPWYRSVRLYRQDGDVWPLVKAAEDLRARFRRV